MRTFRIRTCSSNARAAPVPPPEGPEEAAEELPFTETWEFRAIVAEAVTAALAQACVTASMAGCCKATRLPIAHPRHLTRIFKDRHREFQRGLVLNNPSTAGASDGSQGASKDRWSAKGYAE